MERDIVQLMKTLETDKNLFLFFPYNIYFDENDNILQGQNIAIQAMETDFRQVLTYRAQLRLTRGHLCLFSLFASIHFNHLEGWLSAFS